MQGFNRKGFEIKFLFLTEWFSHTMPPKCLPWSSESILVSLSTSFVSMWLSLESLKLLLRLTFFLLSTRFQEHRIFSFMHLAWVIKIGSSMLLVNNVELFRLVGSAPWHLAIFFGVDSLLCWSSPSSSSSSESSVSTSALRSFF